MFAARLLLRRRQALIALSTLRLVYPRALAGVRAAIVVPLPASPKSNSAAAVRRPRPAQHQCIAIDPKNPTWPPLSLARLLGASVLLVPRSSVTSSEGAGRTDPERSSPLPAEGK